MKNGIEAPPVPVNLPFSGPVNEACGTVFSPILAYAICWRETVEEYGSGSAVKMSDNDDGGHGLFQLTSSFPADWMDPLVNARFAVENFLVPAETYWAQTEQGEALVKCIAAEFNAGRGATIEAHAKGNVDLATTDGYAEAVLGFYLNLLEHGHP